MITVDDVLLWAPEFKKLLTDEPGCVEKFITQATGEVNTRRLGTVGAKALAIYTAHLLTLYRPTYAGPGVISSVTVGPVSKTYYTGDLPPVLKQLDSTTYGQHFQHLVKARLAGPLVGR